jgi:excisionase family DNA binding protein
MLIKSDKLAYRIPEAVHAVGIGRSKLYQLIKDGTLKSVKIGGCTLIPRDALCALVGVGEAA